jgi:ATP-dependent DNA ligase
VKNRARSTKREQYYGRSGVRARLKLGLEGIVSRRKDSRYVSGRSSYWFKMKNPASVAVRREAEEDWS